MPNGIENQNYSWESNIVKAMHKKNRFYRTWLYIWVTLRVSDKKHELLILRENMSSPVVFRWGRVAPVFSFFVLSYYVSLRSEFRVVMPVTISAWKWCSVRLFLRLFVGGRMSYLRYLCLFAYCGVQHILRCFSSSMLPVSLDCPFFDCPFDIL